METMHRRKTRRKSWAGAQCACNRTTNNLNSSEIATQIQDTKKSLNLQKYKTKGPELNRFNYFPLGRKTKLLLARKWCRKCYEKILPEMDWATSKINV